jgi:hypothetical protein
MWKDEDYEYIKNLDNKSLIGTDLFKKSFDVYSQALTDYGDSMSEWKGRFGHYSSEDLLSAFGFEFPRDFDDDEVEDIKYELQNLDTPLSDLVRNKNYPECFPVVTCIENGFIKEEGPNVFHVYMRDFSEDLVVEDFSWLEKNIRNFWINSVGHFYNT